jgi:uncharacterized protein (TIRG00374 family)
MLHALFLVALVILCIGALRQVDLASMARALGAARVPLLLAAIGVDLFSLSMQAGRWLAVVHPVDRRAKATEAFFALVAGYAVGLVIPARASDLARAHLMARRTGGSTATLATTAVVDHLIGVVALVAALSIAAIAWQMPVWVRRAGMLASGLAVASLVALWAAGPARRGARGGVADATPRTGSGKLEAVPEAVPGKYVANFIGRLQDGLAAVRSPRAISLALLFALAGWTAEGVIAHLALEAFRLPSGIGPSMMVVVATTLSAAISVSPGNAGTFEVACVAGLAGFGVSQEAALAFAIGYHAVHLIPTATIGGGWLIWTGFRPAAVRRLM